MGIEYIIDYVAKKGEKKYKYNSRKTISYNWNEVMDKILLDLLETVS